MEKGRVTHSSLFWLRTLKHEGKTKIAVIVPNKVVKTASGRVGLRRRMYEAVKLIHSSIVSDNSLVVICAKEPAVKAEFKDLSKEMKDIFVKSGLLK